MKTVFVKGICGMFLCLSAAGCTAREADVDAPAATDAPPAAAAQVVDRLPLRPGYYVASDTPCAQASNATLHLRSEEGDGYGGFTTPPYFCTFQRIEQTGPSSFRTTEVCGSGFGEDDGHTIATDYEILGESSYSARNDDGWESAARRCPRSELPALWRDDPGMGGFVD